MPAFLRLRAKKFRYAVPSRVRPWTTLSVTFPNDIHFVPVWAFPAPAVNVRPLPLPGTCLWTSDSTHFPVILMLMKYVSAQAPPTFWASASTWRKVCDGRALRGTWISTWAPGFITSKCCPCTLTRCGSPDALTRAVGADVGAAVGADVGVRVGTAVGAKVGNRVGAAVGTAVGALVGAAVGAPVGTAVGAAVGARVGAAVDAAVGAAVGAPVGA